MIITVDEERSFYRILLRSTNLSVDGLRARLARQQLPQYILQDAAIGVVLRFLRCINAHQRLEFDDLVIVLREYFQRAASLEVLHQLTDGSKVKKFLTRQI